MAGELPFSSLDASPDFIFTYVGTKRMATLTAPFGNDEGIRNLEQQALFFPTLAAS